jgi:hypothetical protein
MFIILPVSQFISLLIFRTTLGQRFFGFAVVGKDGEPAGRVRLLWRWCLVWGALAVPLFFNDLGFLLAVAGTVLFWSTCCVIAILNPERGVQDAIAGTRIVPR